MKWLTIQEFARGSGRSERTIRGYASQKKFITERVGKSWRIEISSILNSGLDLPPAFIEKLRSMLEDGSDPRLQNSKTAKNNKTKQSDEKEELQDVVNDPSQDPSASAVKKSRKYTALADLGVYKDLLAIYLQEHEKMSKPISDYMRRCLQFIGLGFHEYSRDKKAECFKQARVSLVYCIVEDDLQSKDKSSWREAIETAIMPGVIGLIRQQEGGSRGKGARNAKASDKNK